MFNSPSNGFAKPNSSDIYLPSEILSHIFSFLRVRDRKNIRLTCSRWYDACNTIPILQSEKMVIPSDSTNTWAYVLMNCPRLQLDIEFGCINLPPDATVFWQKLGSRVKSLKFCYSESNEEFSRQMMKFCNNLEKLHLGEYVLVSRKNNWVLNLDRLEIAHASLKCLVLGDCRSLTDFHFDRLFDIYPCIQELELNDARFNCHECYGCKSLFSFSCVISNIKLKAENIKRLVFNWIDCCFHLNNWLEELASLPGLRLKELELSALTPQTENSFMKFFTHQTHLEYIKVARCEYFSFLHMVRNCSSLKTIETHGMWSISNFITRKEIFHALMLLPSLKILRVNGMPFMEENAHVNRRAPVGALAFKCLQELTLYMPAKYIDMFSPKLPSNLSALHFTTPSGKKGLTDVNLQLIFDKWIHLRSLELSLDSSVSDFGFTGCRIVCSENSIESSGISISRLKRLENLMLMCDDGAENYITRVSFCHFIFPNLRTLKFFNFPKFEITAETLKFLSQNTPSMEYCKLAGCNVENEALSEHEGWKYLRCFPRQNTSPVSHFWSEKMR